MTQPRRSIKSKVSDDVNSDSIVCPSLRTESSNASRFVESNRSRIRFVVSWQKWLVWDGKRWKVDEGQTAVRRLAIRWSRSLWLEYGQIRDLLPQREARTVEAFCKASNSDHGIGAMVHLAASDDSIQVSHEELDSKPRLLNVENGTLNLETGKLHAHDPADLLTQLAPVVFDPDASCPQWVEALELIFNRDSELLRFVRALLGYCLSGDVGEHILPIAIGNGANGKSTVWNVMLAILGSDYAMLAGESLLLGEGQGHPTDKAALFGKRFVPISEPEKGAKLREARVKELTGDSTITARRMREDFWSFKRTHTFFLASNHLPRISGTDDGIWRRIKIVPFKVKLSDVTTPIKNFEEKLVREEASGILNWLLEGFADWLSNGFVEPEAVVNATGSYRTDSDPLGEWLSDCCDVESGSVLSAKEGFESFTSWQESQGISERFRWSQTKFGMELADRFRKEKPSGGTYRRQTIYHGLRLQESAKNSENLELSLGVTTLNVNSKKSAFHRDEQNGWCQPVPNGKSCDSCGSSMNRSDAESGWVNWDCPNCGQVKPEKVTS